jgi:putative tryptophan/tyrosine transport system substrate-binding protein
MRRQDFIVGLVGAAFASLLSAEAQPSMPVIGYVADVQVNPTVIAALRKGLEEQGFVEGSNVHMDMNVVPGQYDKLPAIMADLVRRHVAVIVAEGTANTAEAAHAATSTIPIDAFFGGDPVKDGYVATLNRPGGNVTGVALFTGSSNVLDLKRLEFLQRLLPGIRTIGLLIGPKSLLDRPAEEAAIKARGLDVKVAFVTGDADLETAFATLAQEKIDALLESPSAFFTSHRAALVALAAKYRLPATWEWPEFVEIGGLMSYGPEITDAAHQQGIYAGRILKGEKPADLPVVLPQRFRLFINAKTAKTLGIAVPPNLLAIADEVIE